MTALLYLQRLCFASFTICPLINLRLLELQKPHASSAIRFILPTELPILVYRPARYVLAQNVSLVHRHKPFNDFSGRMNAPPCVCWVVTLSFCTFLLQLDPPVEQVGSPLPLRWGALPFLGLLDDEEPWRGTGALVAPSVEMTYCSLGLRLSLNIIV